MKRCLLISPKSFYSFSDTLRDELESRGMIVNTINDEYPDNVFGIILAKVSLSLSRLLTYYHYKCLLKGSPKYDLVIIIKGRGISVKTVNLLKCHSERVISYAFDSFDYFSGPLDWFEHVDDFCTFDISDSQDYKLRYVELFTQKNTFDSNGFLKEYDFSYIVKNHSGRLKYIDEIYSAMSSKYSFNIYIYEKSLLTGFINFIREPVLFLRWFKFIKFSSLNAIEFDAFLKTSKVTIDYAHPKQTGLTMRCFQAAANGVGVLTNNSWALQSKAIECSNFYVYKAGSKLSIESAGIFVNKGKFKSVHRAPKDFIGDLLGDIDEA